MNGERHFFYREFTRKRQRLFFGGTGGDQEPRTLVSGMGAARVVGMGCSENGRDGALRDAEGDHALKRVASKGGEAG